MAKCAKRDFLDYRDREIILKLADCDMSVSEAARQLYMHRNAVVYHVEKSKEQQERIPEVFTIYVILSK